MGKSDGGADGRSCCSQTMLLPLLEVDEFSRCTRRTEFAGQWIAGQGKQQ